MLFITLLVVVVALFVLFWALSVFFQAYLYNEPASNLPARAAIAALVVGGAIGLWTYANAHSDRKGKYGPLHDFDSTGNTDVYEFAAVRKYVNEKGPDGQWKEDKTIFRRPDGQKNGVFTDEKSGKPFVLSTSNFITTGLEMKEPDGKVGKFDAVFTQKDVYTPDKRFDEKGTKRHVDGDSPGAIFAPSTKAMIYAVLLNVLSYAAWFVAFWLVLRFAFPHAAGLAIVFGLLTMLVIAPLLFERVRPKDGLSSKISAPVAPNVPIVTDAEQAKDPGK